MLPMRTHLSALALASLVALSGCTGSPAPSAPSPSPSPTPLTIDGTLSLSGADAEYGYTKEDGSSAMRYDTFWAFTNADGSEFCAGHNGYDDVDSGSQITVSSPSGEVVGVATLESGHLVPDNVDEEAGKCKFSFVIRDVPPHPLYQIRLGDRPATTMTAAEVKDGLDLTL